MAVGKALGPPTERQIEQIEQFEAEQVEQRSLFDTVGERVVAPVMSSFAEELGRNERWVGDAPTVETRPSGSGIRSLGEFKVPGSVDGETRDVRMTLELFPTTGERFITFFQIGDKVERKTFEAGPFTATDDADASEPAANGEEGSDEPAPKSAEETLRSWLDTQFDKHVRRRPARF